MTTTAITTTKSARRTRKSGKKTPLSMNIKSREELLFFIKVGKKLNEKNKKRLTSSEIRTLLEI
ncbi:hypothetical protein IJG20_02060 [Candidatus Saccharibacteria bacterium]|nr:hypothetical protein [Candidatus Saccharibacteria bacterium]